MVEEQNVVDMYIAKYFYLPCPAFASPGSVFPLGFVFTVVAVDSDCFQCHSFMFRVS